jgi:hypothetical protein
MRVITGGVGTGDNNVGVSTGGAGVGRERHRPYTRYACSGGDGHHRRTAGHRRHPHRHGRASTG